MGRMLTSQDPTGEALAADRAAEDRSLAQKMAEEFMPKVLPDIAAMSKEELAMLLHGLVCKLTVIESEWRYRRSYVKSDILDSDPCRSILRLYCALDDYKYLAMLEDCRAQLESISARNAEIGGCVYVAKFADGHIKIGHSIAPARRLRDLAGGNQSAMLRHWISDRVKSAAKLEHRAHRHFAKHRAGGEFFKVDFYEAVTWIAGELRKETQAC